MSKPTSIENPHYLSIPAPPGGFKSFSTFYPFYLGEHSQPTTRRLHFAGTAIGLSGLARSTLALLPIGLSYLSQYIAKCNAPSNVIKTFGSITQHTLWLGLEGPIYVPLLAGTVIAYALAWTSHYFVEKNKPASFKHPVWSQLADYKMLWEVITLRRAF